MSVAPREISTETTKSKKEATTPYLENAPHRAVVDPQRLVQRSVERGAVIVELLPQLLLLLGVGEGGRLVDTLLAQARRGGVGRGGLDAASRAPSHHVVVPQSNKRPRLGLGG
jgi:hypothetical protein